jgi:hypothetical protein
MTTGLPAFDQAEAEFRSALLGMGHDLPLVWLFREDVLAGKDLYRVRLPLPANQRAATERVYDEGRRRGFGVRLEVFCRLGATLACYVWSPRDELEGQYTHLPSARLKFTVPVDLKTAVGITTDAGWWAARVRVRLLGSSSWSNDLPHRPLLP